MKIGTRERYLIACTNSIAQLRLYSEPSVCLLRFMDLQFLSTFKNDLQSDQLHIFCVHCLYDGIRRNTIFKKKQSVQQCV